jgi:triosephosphate isomerase (TIM)
MKYVTRSGQPVIAGNWKMHKGPAATRDFFAQFSELWPTSNGRTVLFFPPAVSLTTAREVLRERPDLLLGIQNIHGQAEGAFTGEISAPLARDAGATHALVGHSERRHLFGETDDEVRQKVSAAIRYGLIPVVCVGETLEERTAGQVEPVITRQLEAALSGVPEAYGGELLIAYEPVWAIGTGVTATPADAAAAHLVLRALLADRLGASSPIPILYGGSVKPENARELLTAEAVDGLLVGGASLDPAGFAQIAAAG